MWGQKQCLPDSDDERMGGPLTKKARVPSLKRGSKAEEKREWQECVVDMLEVTNVE